MYARPSPFILHPIGLDEREAEPVVDPARDGVESGVRGVDGGPGGGEAEEGGLDRVVER